MPKRRKSRRRSSKRRKSKFTYKPSNVTAAMNAGYNDGGKGVKNNTFKEGSKEHAAYERGFLAGERTKTSIMGNK